MSSGDTVNTLYVAPPGILTVSYAPTYVCGWIAPDGIWHHQLRRSADDAILKYYRGPWCIYDAAKACP